MGFCIDYDSAPLIAAIIIAIVIIIIIFNCTFEDTSFKAKILLGFLVFIIIWVLLIGVMTRWCFPIGSWFILLLPVMLLITWCLSWFLSNPC